MADVDLGDRITFQIQGVPMEAPVTSIRRRVESSPRPFFYFVFPPEFLAGVPEDDIRRPEADPAERAILQNRVAAFPNVMLSTSAPPRPRQRRWSAGSRASSVCSRFSGLSRAC